MKKRYPDSGIVILGYSIGTGPAAYLASRNAAKLLILQAPYYTFADLAGRLYPIVPSFLLKYQFNTAAYLKSCRMPVVLFHGRGDEVVYYGSSLKLKKEFKPGDTLITLEGQGHNGMTDNPDYVAAVRAILQ
jgi:pimeloyl-ACP methyl ester carboxylesterase